MRDGKCNYCQASELAKNIWNEGKCRNCGAGLKNNLIKDKENRFVCRYCGWPVTERPIEDTLRSPSTPPDDNPLPPNSPVATITASQPLEHGLSLFPVVIGIILINFIIASLVSPLFSKGMIANVTSTNHTVDVPSYTPGVGIILIGGAFASGIALTFLILRNRHRRELRRQQKLLGASNQ